MTQVLFVHDGSSGRFRFLAEALVRRGWSCAFINDQPGQGLPDMPAAVWRTDLRSTPGLYPPAIRAENDFLRGRAAADCALQFKADGFEPSLIVGHPGWGEMLFLDEVFPGVPQIQVAEFYYRTRGGDLDFDPEFAQADIEEKARVHAKNAGLAMSYAAAARIVAPTPFQAGRLPEAFRRNCRIIHEGIDTELTRPRNIPELRTPSGLTFTRDMPVITFINRVFEPMRGVHTFMRALPRMLEALPGAHVLMIGSDEHKGYGAAAPGGASWKRTLLAELDGRIDLQRVHFTGQIAYDSLIDVLGVSAAHVYLTYPFVLSWSLLDAMACECLVIGSDTAPVRDVIEPGVNGLLTDFFDHGALADAVIEACQAPERYAPLRKAARATVLKNYDRATVCLPAWLALIDEVLAERASE